MGGFRQISSNLVGVLSIFSLIWGGWVSFIIVFSYWGELGIFLIIFLEFWGGLDISPTKIAIFGGGVGEKSKFWGLLEHNDMRTFSFRGGMDR